MRDVRMMWQPILKKQKKPTSFKAQSKVKIEIETTSSAIPKNA